AVVGPTAAAPPAASSQQPGAPAAVVHQVFPEITRLSLAGNGTHRLTVTLQPEHLGEVRVTLVVRDGAVRVSIGSDHATEALIQGAPELRRLLEQAGATDARVVIRDASPAGTDAPGTEPRGQRDTGQHDAGQHDAGQHDAGAGTRERSASRQDPPPDGPVRPVHPASPPDSATTPGRLDRLM
ncbi:flagellar hook-length control protein FliK, partial [Nocardioides pelophilus]|uniref:flagellar hook-length control protein FliK n=1 Tax=Nocardioides pelophilus TaxID=2172019 RepID=UPI001601D429